MKKYYTLFLGVLLAALPFALTSCGDDEPDDPNKAKSTFTVNGKPYYDMYQSVHGEPEATLYNYIEGLETAQINFEFSASNNQDDLDSWNPTGVYVMIYTKSFDSSTIAGKELELTDDIKVSIADGPYLKEYVSGSISVVSIKDDRATIKFNNLKVCEEDNSSNSAILNGTVVCQYDEI